MNLLKISMNNQVSVMYWVSNRHRCKVYVLVWFEKLFLIEWVRTRVTFREIDVEAEIGKKVSDQNF